MKIGGTIITINKLNDAIKEARIYYEKEKLKKIKELLQDLPDDQEVFIAEINSKWKENEFKVRYHTYFYACKTFQEAQKTIKLFGETFSTFESANILLNVSKNKIKEIEELMNG